MTIIGFIGSALLLLMIASCQNEGQIEFDRYYSSGSLVYQTHCQNCHGVKGEGLGALIPPLTDSTYLKNNRTMLACILQNGQKGVLHIAGKPYESEMPKTGLAPLEIARVLTYITNSFGNKMGTITSDEVEKDLKNCH